MANKWIDLHTHSTKSDGTLTPAELAAHAKEVGLSAIALTDHDTDEGCAEFIEECEKLGIEGIAGVEIGAKYKRELHIVGLYAKGDEFEAMLTKLKNGRAERNRLMVKKIQEYGFDITEDDITNEELGVTIESSGRLYMAEALLRKGFVKTRQEAFDKYLAKDRPCFVKRFGLSPEESIKLIKRSGGIAIWAHPVYTVDSEEELDALSVELKGYGLDAMECYYSEYSAEQSEMCIRAAKKAGLKMSGGSDFHGANKPGVKLGEVNDGHVPYELLEKLRSSINCPDRA